MEGTRIVGSVQYIMRESAAANELVALRASYMRDKPCVGTFSQKENQLYKASSLPADLIQLIYPLGRPQ